MGDSLFLFLENFLPGSKQHRKAPAGIGRAGGGKLEETEAGGLQQFLIVSLEDLGGFAAIEAYGMQGRILPEKGGKII